MPSVYTVGFPNASVSVATDGCGARIIDLTEPEIEALVDANPYYAFVTIPAGTYATTDTEITTFGVRATLVTSADVSEDTVYEITRAVFLKISTIFAICIWPFRCSKPTR